MAANAGFDPECLSEECRAALAETSPERAVRELVARAVSDPAAVPLGRGIIHSVTNPIPRFSSALHVYGGDFFAVERSEWDPETLLEQRFDMEKAMRLFAEVNARWSVSR